MEKESNGDPVARALVDGPLPAWDLVGPTANDDIRRAIGRYGAEAVKKAVKEATKAKRGRKPEPDWPELLEVMKADAREWLAGNDPFTARTNYAIAKDYAERNPGQSAASTHQRIEGKLSRKPYGRRWYVLVLAENLSRDNGPHEAHLRTLEALSGLPESERPDLWKFSLDRARATLADYEAREGHPPPAKMTFREVEEAVQKGSLVGLLAAPPKMGGLFGLASPKQTSSGKTSLGSLLSNALDGSDG